MKTDENGLFFRRFITISPLHYIFFPLGWGPTQMLTSAGSIWKKSLMLEGLVWSFLLIYHAILSKPLHSLKLFSVPLFYIHVFVAISKRKRVQTFDVIFVFWCDFPQSSPISSRNPMWVKTNSGSLPSYSSLKIRNETWDHRTNRVQESLARKTAWFPNFFERILDKTVLSLLSNPCR